MLPGVECARRRRLYKSKVESDSTKRSFCLYTRNLKSTTSSPTSFLRQNQYSYPDEKLGGSAREAKRRLDEKFTASMKSENYKRRKSLFSWRLNLFH
ncbi:hypothetical protein MtrunA17_Chr4g0065191 [Medicago truncatula]|uniref:E3 ubiquitin-protein ligase RING1-like protein, putative n=1 Tax=Medicago truncatula TaxID=3880 RepID=B7FMU6_MEDTR|nr:unknown [Medicago truncatula]AES91708.1 E3 ubiquitin-protein ligase RING1-like protein, putative [Medicago truncatula]AFK40841.1 unknown [Medicago truncatula]RHN64073.1 hypothetical protein MtrunA17_Chr4g0065191 [Medicago truncatula]